MFISSLREKEKKGGEGHGEHQLPCGALNLDYKVNKGHQVRHDPVTQIPSRQGRTRVKTYLLPEPTRTTTTTTGLTLPS